MITLNKYKCRGYHRGITSWWKVSTPWHFFRQWLSSMCCHLLPLNPISSSTINISTNASSSPSHNLWIQNSLNNIIKCNQMALIILASYYIGPPWPILDAFFIVAWTWVKCPCFFTKSRVNIYIYMNILIGDHLIILHM